MNVDLSTRYLGLSLRNPLVVSAGPVTDHIELLPKLEELGAAALVLPSLFEEQIEHHEWQVHLLDEYGADSFAEAPTYLPRLDDHRIGPDAYLRKIEAAKKAVSIPVIASLNGNSPGGWVHYAKLFEAAGADAIELNIYLLPSDPQQTGSNIEERYLDLVRAVRAEVDRPLAVKIGPYFSSIPSMGARLLEAGADGLVLFNRFVHPDIDLEAMDVAPKLELSTPAEARLAMQWIGILRGRVQGSLAANGGIHSAEDVIKLLLVGADVTMFLATLLKRGVGHLRDILSQLTEWLEEREYASVEQMKGSLCQLHAPHPEGFERVNYMRALASYCGPNV